jgi:hypothetical protein
MASVVSPAQSSGMQQPRDKSNRENHEPAVSPQQVWGLLALPQQQQVMRVVIQAGHILAQREAKERGNESH